MCMLHLLLLLLHSSRRTRISCCCCRHYCGRGLVAVAFGVGKALCFGEHACDKPLETTLPPALVVVVIILFQVPRLRRVWIAVVLTATHHAFSTLLEQEKPAYDRADKDEENTDYKACDGTTAHATFILVWDIG